MSPPTHAKCKGNSPPSPLLVLLPLSLQKGLQKSVQQHQEQWAEEWAWWGQAVGEQRWGEVVVQWVWLPWQGVGLMVQAGPQVVGSP